MRGVFLTHAHFDHIYGLNRLIEIFPDALVYTNAQGKAALLNPKWNFSKYHDEVEDFIFYKHENIRVIGAEGLIALENGLEINVMFTPGHEPSCITYKINDCLFTGDSYIPGIKTVTSFPRSNKELAEKSLETLKYAEKQGAMILPGHWIEQGP